MFDIKPVDESGALDVVAIAALTPQINLRRPAKKSRPNRPVLVPLAFSQEATAELAIERSAIRAVVPHKDEVLRELEAVLNRETNPHEELSRFGALIAHQRTAKPRYRPIIAKKPKQVSIPELPLDPHLLAEIQRPLGGRVQESAVEELPHVPEATPLLAAVHTEEAFNAPIGTLDEWYRPRVPIVRSGWQRFSWLTWPGRTAVISVMAVLALVAGTRYGIGLKDRVIRQGTTAVQNLETAKESIEALKFAAASEQFTSAYQQFSSAGKDLNVFGAAVGSLIADLPGAGKLKSAQNLMEIGKLVAATGGSMSDAIETIARTGMLFNSETSAHVFSSQVLAPLKEALYSSSKNLRKAQALVAGVDPAAIPEVKRSDFSDFAARLPEFQNLVDQGIGYAKFLETLVGAHGQKRYLLMFQNSSELRPTGGFPGSYGIVTFQDGQLRDTVVDDVYNVDGQLTSLVVPPKPLQHITPNWAMRDANWFVDFPASARKIMEFYRRESGSDVDGVLTLNPNIIAKILGIVGPIEMPEYHLTLTADTFIADVQNQVEYGDDKKINQPKKILIEMAPRLLRKLASAEHATWLEVMNVLLAGLDQKSMLMYFRDPALQQFARERGFSGEIAQPDSDYLMTVFSNVKGSKSDAVTDTALKVTTVFGDDGIRHRLTITRRHNGGSSRYGFYNRQNPSYVRVLVPAGSRLIGIAGNSTPSYAPLLDYAKTDFVRDPDLERLEAGMRMEHGVSVLQESGKTEFGFWVITNPGQITTVELDYAVPDTLARSSYQLYVQKQPGLDVSRFEFDLATPHGMTVAGSKPALARIADGYHGVFDFAKDLPVTVEFK